MHHPAANTPCALPFARRFDHVLVFDAVSLYIMERSFLACRYLVHRFNSPAVFGDFMHVPTSNHRRNQTHIIYKIWGVQMIGCGPRGRLRTRIHLSLNSLTTRPSYLHRLLCFCHLIRYVGTKPSLQALEVLGYVDVGSPSCPLLYLPHN